MTISNISSTGTQELWQLLAASLQIGDTSTSGAQVGSGSATTAVDLSQPGKLFSELKQMSENDPDKFKSVMTAIADQIEKAAEATSDDKQSEILKKVAANFEKAAESGDLSAAVPPGPPPMGPPPSGNVENGSGGSIGAYTQVQNADTNGFQTVLDNINAVLEKNTSS